MKKNIIFLIITLFVIACTPKVGSDEWCKNLLEKPKGDWSINEAKDYAKHCILK